MLRYLSIIVIWVLFYQNTSAQLSSDALLFSERLQPNTARSAAVGGSIGALGGDLSSLTRNPAGLGIYRSAEFAFTPSMQFSNIQSTFVSDSAQPLSTNSRIAFNLGSLGMVLSQSSTDDWRYVNFGVSYGKVASFNKTLSFQGTSTGSRIINFVDQANQSEALPDNLNPLEERLAWDAFFIDNPTGNPEYVGAVIDSNRSLIEKKQLVRQSGGIRELAISLAGNYLHKLYIGATIGINMLRFREFRNYSEIEPTGNMDFKRLDFNENREVDGLGANFKFGFIYRINKKFRFGASVHTPTVYSLTEELNNSISGAVIWQDTLREISSEDPTLSPTGKYMHNYFTPWQFGANLGYIVGQKTSKIKGFLNIDADYLNYGQASFALKTLDDNVTPTDQAYINNINEAITENYKDVFRIKVGGELALSSLRLRAGYRLQTSPYTTVVEGIDDLRHDISAGIGVRKKHIFFDVSYVNTITNFEYTPYYATSAYNNPRTLNKQRTGSVLATIGLKF